MLSNAITHRLFVVPLANNDHGKTTIIRSIVRQGERRAIDVVKRCVRQLASPWGRMIDALVIPRSYQETLQGEFGPIEKALDSVDEWWRARDLIIFPSHLDQEACNEMIRLGQGAGFDVVVVPIILNDDDLPQYRECLQLPWDARWTLHNGKSDSPDAKLEALGNDLWAWIAGAIEQR